jgi:hypothetical protein
MKTYRILAMALFMGACGLAAAEQSPGEAVVYDGPDFSGRSRVLRNDAPNFEYGGLNDRISSIYVVRGTWEFCTDAYYHGTCRSFPPGEYRNLGRQSNRISSGRVVRASHGERERRGDVLLFDRPDMKGFLAGLDGPAPNFEPLGFNDRVASIEVRRGTWEFCTDADFRGACRVYGPGEYGRLPGGHGDAYSSARPVAQGSPAAARVRMFEAENFQGRSVWYSDNVTNLEHTGFNDRFESMIIESGRWRFCSDANGQGQCREFGPGRYPILPHELRSRISSLYRAAR